jgi:hypothetical protein
MLVAAFVVGGERRTALLGVALALGSLATLEFAVREHFAGYRSHSLLLAAVPALVAVGLLYYLAPAELAAPLRLAIGGAVFGVAFFLLTAAFRRRTGVAFKVK